MAPSRVGNTNDADDAKLSMDTDEDNDDQSATTVPSGIPTKHFEAGSAEIFIHHEITLKVETRMTKDHISATPPSYTSCINLSLKLIYN
jgi:hypothetical protein